jgi:hypothetical protein
LGKAAHLGQLVAAFYLARAGCYGDGQREKRKQQGRSGNKKKAFSRGLG